MPDQTADLPCPLCTHPVFDGRAAVQCAKCGVFCHRPCWVEADRCAVVQCGSKKWNPVAVVRLEPPGPGTDEIAAAARAEFESVLHPLVADLRSEVAHREDLEKLHAALEAATKASAQRDERLLQRLGDVAADLERRLGEQHRALADVGRLVAGLPTTGPAEIAEVARAAAASAERSAEQLRSDVRTALADLARTVAVESHRNLVAIEACRWDTAARRRPLPWDGRSDAVLEPAPGPREPLGTLPGSAS